jgi:hypothetical protein
MERIFNKEKIGDGNSLLNMNITNSTNSYLNGNGTLAGKKIDSYQDKNFFDNSVLNKIKYVRDNSPTQNINVGNILIKFFNGNIYLFIANLISS